MTTDNSAVIARLERERDELAEALWDMLGGWKYIRQWHGDIYGIGWDRAQQKADSALANLDSEPAEQPAVPEWIPCSERLPAGAPPKNYLAYRPDAPEDSKVCSLRYCELYNGWSGQYEVTHWDELPEPPQGGRD